MSESQDADENLSAEEASAKADEIVENTADDEVEEINISGGQTDGMRTAKLLQSVTIDSADVDDFDDLHPVVEDGDVLGVRDDERDAVDCHECSLSFNSEVGLAMHWDVAHATDAKTSVDDVELTDVLHSHDPAEQRKYDWSDVRTCYSGDDKTTARNAVVNLLIDREDWMAIWEHCDQTKSFYELHRWDDDRGWVDDGNRWIKQIMTEELNAHATDNEVSKIVSQLAAHSWVTEEETNASHKDETLIPVANGVINLDEIDCDENGRIDASSVELQEFDKSNRFVYRIETRWDPETADVDGLMEWMEEITKSQQDRRVLTEFSGHALHPRYPSDGFLTVVGDGQSGKSQWLEVVREMIGARNCTSKAISDIENRFGKASVVNSRANINTELNGTKLDSIAKLKTMSAGEAVDVERKNVDGWTEVNDATMLFASDDPPSFPTANKALGRRLYPIEFPASYVDDPDPDAEFEFKARSKTVVQDELQDESRLQAMLIKSVEGLARLLEQGGFSDERDWEERVAEYESYSDPIKHFARSCLEDMDSADVTYEGLHASDLKAVFDRFAASRNHESKSLRQISKVLNSIPELSPRKSRNRTYTAGDGRDTFYRGVAWSDEAVERYVEDSDVAADRYLAAHDTNPESEDNEDNGDDEGEESGDARTTTQDVLDMQRVDGRVTIKGEITHDASTDYNNEEAWMLKDAFNVIEVQCFESQGLSIGDVVSISGASPEVSKNSMNRLVLKPGAVTVEKLDADQTSVLDGGGGE